MRNKYLSKYTFILTLLFWFSISYGDSVARIMKSEGLVYIKRLGMQTYAEVAQAGGSVSYTHLRAHET